MNVYQRTTEEDYLLCQWYECLVTTEDLALTFPTSLYPLGAFLRAWASPRQLLTYEADKQGIWFAAWFEPFFGGAAFGMWVRRDRRGTRRALLAFQLALASAFHHFPVVVASTTSDRVVQMATKLGFAYIGAIPHLAPSRTYVLYLTKESFDGKAWSRNFRDQGARAILH